ncbi:MAG: hypothetical protein PHW96_00350 [Candidatus Nanoarchaeia archaeon]|nr:hypothetical protein [Candidatus Nanoarchaeia archaeon]
MKLMPLFLIAMLGITFLLGCTATISDTTGGEELTPDEAQGVLDNLEDTIIDDYSEIDLGELI